LLEDGRTQALDASRDNGHRRAALEAHDPAIP
jgi:hypothetical protein